MALEDGSRGLSSVPLKNREAINPVQWCPRICSGGCMCGSAAPCAESTSSLPVPPRLSKRFGLSTSWKCMKPTAEDFQIMSLAKPEIHLLAASNPLLEASCCRIFPVLSRGKTEPTLRSLRICHKWPALESQGRQCMWSWATCPK